MDSAEHAAAYMRVHVGSRSSGHTRHPQSEDGQRTQSSHSESSCQGRTLFNPSMDAGHVEELKNGMAFRPPAAMISVKKTLKLSREPEKAHEEAYDNCTTAMAPAFSEVNDCACEPSLRTRLICPSHGRAWFDADDLCECESGRRCADENSCSVGAVNGNYQFGLLSVLHEP